MLLKCPYLYSYWVLVVQFVMLLENIQENNSNLSKIGHEGWCFVDYIASDFRQLSFCPVLYHMNELQQSHTPRTLRWATPLCFSYHDRLPFLWNCEPKQALLRFSCFCHVFCHSDKKNSLSSQSLHPVTFGSRYRVPQSNTRANSRSLAEKREEEWYKYSAHILN